MKCYYLGADWEFERYAKATGVGGAIPHPTEPPLFETCDAWSTYGHRLELVHTHSKTLKILKKCSLSLSLGLLSQSLIKFGAQHRAAILHAIQKFSHSCVEIAIGNPNTGQMGLFPIILALGMISSVYLMHVLTQEITHARQLNQCLERSENIETIQDKDCSVIIYSRNDHNGALNNPPQEEINACTQAGLTPIFKRVHTPEEALDILDTLKSGQNRIQRLSLGAHGTYYGMCFDGILPYRYKKEGPLEKLVDAVEKNGTIVLCSCNTGNETHWFPPIALQFSLYRKDLSIYAPSKETNGEKVWYTPHLRKIDVTMRLRDEDVTSLFWSGKTIEPFETCMLCTSIGKY